MARQVFGLFADGFMEPLGDFRGVDVVVVDPIFFTCIIGRVYENDINFPGVIGKQGFQGNEIIALNQHIAGIWSAI